MNISFDYSRYSQQQAEYDRLLTQIVLQSMLDRDVVTNYVGKQAEASSRTVLDILRDVAAEANAAFALGRRFELPLQREAVRQPEASGTFEFTISAQVADALMICPVLEDDPRVTPPLKDRIGAIFKTLYVTPQEAERLVSAIAEWNRRHDETALGDNR